MNENFAARAGRWSAQHRKAAILGWIAFVVAAVVLGGAVGTKKLADGDDGAGESGRAEKTLAQAFPQADRESVLVQSRRLSADDPAFRSAVADVARRLRGVPAVAEVGAPVVSADGHSVLLDAKLRDGDDDARADATLAATAAAAAAHPELRIEQFGDLTAAQAIGHSFDDDFKKAEFLSLPVTLVILVVAFGSLLAAGLPVMLAMSAVAATIGLLGFASQLVPMDDAVSSVVLLVGLAVGVDYSLFYLRREREERAAGRDEQAALLAAAATSGRAILVSGITVMIAMAGMFLSGAPTFTALGTGAILVVGVALIASLTVLPAILSKLGDRVE